MKAVASEISIIHQSGRPVLVVLLLKKVRYWSLLTERQISHNLLNAKPENVERESEIIAQAGESRAVTIATNMAGRGTDIILGGNSEYMARLKLREILMGCLVKPEELSNIAQLNQNKPFGFQSSESNPSNNDKSILPFSLSENNESQIARDYP